jgi:D-xylose transport system substrate-binding protein
MNLITKAEDRVQSGLCRQLFILGLLLVNLMACDSGQKPLPEKAVHIGFSMDSLVVERWTHDLAEFQSYAQAQGARVSVRIGISQNEQQIKDIESLITSGVDALVIVPGDSKSLLPALNLAREKGIPVVAYDRLILEAPVDAFVSFDTLAVGRTMALAVTENLPEGNLMIVNGGSVDHNATFLRQGIGQVIMEENSPYNIPWEISPRNWDVKEILPQLEEIFDGGDFPEAIIAGNDYFATEIIRLLNRYQRGGEVLVVGQDADLVACQNLYRGLQLATVYKPIPFLAQKAADLAILLAQGKSLPKAEGLDNGLMTVPTFMIDPQLITQDNLLEFIEESGYHSLEDVIDPR